MTASVVLITYNSEDFILETLDSIKAQSYKELELIISDDNSGDKTLSICNSWLKSNSQRFIRTKLITSGINTGVSENCNRGLKEAKGEWIKFCAGDDGLKPNCISDNISHISQNQGIKVLFSRIDIFGNTFKPENLIKTIPQSVITSNGLFSKSKSALQQYRMLLLSDRVNNTPSVFINRKTLLSVGGFDPRFKMLEDYPLWLNLTRSGHKLYFMEKVTVNYRQHIKAINNNGSDSLINPNYFKQEKLRRIYTYPYLPKDILYSQKFIWYGSQIFRNKFLNKKTAFRKSVYLLLTIYMNPFRYFIWFRKRLSKKVKANDFYA